MRYLAPIARTTGSVGQQPATRHTSHNWFIDVNAHYNEAGFIDAPDTLPSGSVRGIVFDAMTIGKTRHEALAVGLSYIDREGV